MEQAGAEGYTPYRRSYRARMVRFPCGRRETLLRCIDVYQPTPGQAIALAQALANGVRAARANLDPDARAALNVAKACARARRQLRWAIQCIEADRLLTLTYRDNVTDRARALADWNSFRRLVMARYPDWVYVAVMEHQQRGAIHFHVAVRGHQDVNALRSAWYRVVGAGMGQINVAYRKPRWGEEREAWKAAKIAGYMAKYIGKEFDATPKGARRFFGSRDRAQPVIDRWWIQAKTDTEAFEAAYRATCGGRAVGVRQWLSGDGVFYWVSGPPPDREVPF